MLVVVGGDGAAELVTEGRIVAEGVSNGSDDVLALSVEVGEEDAAAIAAADTVRVALLDPAADPAFEVHD
jgi:hypothetical protein